MILRFQVLDELPSDWEWPANDIDFHDAFAADSIQFVFKITGHMPWIAGRIDCHHRATTRDSWRGANHRRTSKRMTDEQRWRRIFACEEFSRRDQVRDIRRQCRVREPAFALS